MHLHNLFLGVAIPGRWSTRLHKSRGDLFRDGAPVDTIRPGDPGDLSDMRKRMKPDVHLRAGTILRRLGLSFDFGFMLLQPNSTFGRVRNNVRFLDAFVGDGYAVAGFCRMLPYAGTPIKKQLVGEGRLEGTAFQPDYKFLDPKLDFFYDWMVHTFHERNFTDRGLNHIFRAALFEARLQLPTNRVASRVRRLMQYLCARCNRLALYTLTQAIDHIEATSLERLRAEPAFLAGLRMSEQQQELRNLEEVMELYQRFDSAEPSSGAARSDFRPVGSFERTWTHAEAG